MIINYETILRDQIILNKAKIDFLILDEAQKVKNYARITSYNVCYTKLLRRSLYGIDIQYDQSQKVYYIKYDDNSEIQHHLLEAFDTVNAFKLSSNLSSGIYFQKRKPKGTENLYGLVHAIKNKLVVTFDYQKFYEDKPSHRTVHAIALKEYRSRWYLMAIT